MDNSKKHPIIANGETYVESLRRKSHPVNINYPYEYEEAKSRLGTDISNIQQAITQSKEVFGKEKVICVRLEEKFEAKSYTPTALISDSRMKLVGGRKYTLGEDKQKGKLYFLRVNDEDLEELKKKMNSSKKDDIKAWRNQIRTIRSIDLLEPEEKAFGFTEEWNSGNVEIVIHPLAEETNKVIDDFFNIIQIDKKQAVIRIYDDGLTFICMNMDRKTMKQAQYYNPLRSLKPISDEYDAPFRMASISANAPQLPTIVLKGNIKVGVFDGGIKNDTELLKPFAKNYDMVTQPATQKGLEHGSLVSSAVLYGNLAGMTEKDKVKNPEILVESFRVFPAKKTENPEEDYQMYSTIDIIESVVKQRTDIKIFNISCGPRGAICDDELNRFTYVCDKLTYEVEGVNPLFCIAAGNDGELEACDNRIQSPSDMVNGISVGAYSYTPLNEKVRAYYSCKGPGREGAKIKPDILEFGGTPERPFIGVLEENNKIGAQIGTSFAAPIVAGKVARLVAKSKKIVPHLARTLLIHNAESQGIDGKIENGFGYCPESIEQILDCTDNNVTILYSGEIMSSTSVKLPIFMPDVNKMEGKAKVQWTISTVVNPNIKDPDAYTNNCIEDTFYPHDMTFNFNKKGNKTIKLNLLKDGSVQKAEDIMNAGYSMSELPVSKPAKKNFKEADLRNSDFKWDTIIKKDVSMMTTSLLNPFLSLHAIGRDEYEHEKIRYNVVITMSVPKFRGSLYDSILQNYRNLAPIQIRNVNRIKSEV